MAGQGCIFTVQFLVGFIVDRIIRFLAGLPFGRIFLSDIRHRLSAEFKMLVLDSPRIWRFPVGVIHDCHTLMVDFVITFCFKM